MKRKLLSLLLVITLLAVTVSTGLPSILAADDNLFTNGDFADYSGGKPTGWNTNFDSSSGGAIQVVEDVEINDSLTTNAVKITTTGNTASKSHFYYANKIKIEKNASYTTTFWVKVKNIKGVTPYMYEPDYIDKSGALKNNWLPQEGGNIYTYSYDNGTTRVIRTDIKHSWVIAETGNKIDNSNVSMAISRVNNQNQVLTPDYPNSQREGEWLQVIHTFTTSNVAAHEADVTYSISFPSASNGEIWVADFKMNVIKSEIDDYYTPAINDVTLGTVSKDVPLINGKVVEISAEAFGENKFEGWFVDGNLASEEATLTFTYDSNNPPKYEARFTKAEFGIDGSYENSTEGKVANDPKATVGEWSEQLFKQGTVDGIHYVDSNNAGTWRAASISKEIAHTGEYSLKFTGMWGSVGRKFTGLNQNTDYTITFYSRSALTGSGTDAYIKSVIVTDADYSFIKNNNGTLAPKAMGEAGVLYRNDSVYENVNKWVKISATFNTGNSTDVIIWVNSSSAGCNLYLDNFSVARVPASFKPLVNNTDLGFASPAEGIPCVPGDEVTFTATPLDGNYFEGWYLGDQLLSSDLAYTFTYSNELQGIEARFKAGEYTVPNAGFETGYTNGQVLAEQDNNLSYENGKDISAWNEDLYKTTSRDGNNMFFIDSDWSKYGKAIATTEQAHTGKFSVKFSPNSRSIGYKIGGLKEDTNYAVSFYAMTKNTSGSGKTIGSVVVTDSGMSCITIYDGRLTTRKTNTGALGEKECGGMNFRDTWQKITVEFNSKDSTEIIVWVRPESGGTALYLDNFAVFEPISGSVSADLGGSVSSDITSKTMSKGTRVNLSATPLEGNTFAGWFDLVGNLISDQANYTFTADASFSLLAKFDGYNKPATDLFAMNGKDGTFENGDVPGWFFKDTQYACDWCAAGVTNMVAYEGSKSLMINARYRNSLLPLTGLVPNSTYRLSFYINQPDTNDKAKVDSLAIIGEADEGFGTADTIFTSQKLVASNSGWNRIDMYFNSGANTAATFAIRFSAETLDGFKDRLYIDNLSLYRYASNDDILNGGLDDGKSGWIGDGTVVTEAGNNALALNKNESVYQNVAVKDYSAYTVSFKAKGKVLAAAQDLAKFDVNIKNFISSKSYVEVDGTEWTKYFYKLYTGVHKSVNVAFKALEDGAMIDDLSIVKEKQTAGSVVEYIDFESERFDLTSATDTSVYSLYTATGDSDPYVYSGRRSLKFTYNELLYGANNFFNEAYLSYQPGIGNSIKVSMKVKIVEGKQGGFVGLAPEYSGTYGADTGFEHMSKTTEWQTISFYINNSTYAVFKAKINSVADSTAGDFYVDDIVIEITPPMVMEENAKITYCERLYNAVKNEGFESPASNKDWGTLPSTAKIVKGNALKGEKFLRAEGGTHYVIPVTIQPNKEYYFAASVRGTAKTVGSIGITLDSKGTEYYLNRDDEIASVVEFDSENTGWKRSAFKFTTDGDVAYLTIDVKEGALDIDSVMLFTSEYGYRFDPNDYTNYVPYDYDNLKSASTVINGGYGDQPYYKGPAGETGDIVGDGSSPSTGDSLALPVITIVLAVVASAVLMLIRKRKEGAENA